MSKRNRKFENPKKSSLGCELGCPRSKMRYGKILKLLRELHEVEKINRNLPPNVIEYILSKDFFETY